MGAQDVAEAAKQRVGTLLLEKWRLDALLGCGGMAAVYAATHRNKNRAAIKILWPRISADPMLRKRFMREGYAANSIKHPAAVRVYDDGVAEDGSAFLVMDLLEGHTLSQLRRQEGGKLDTARTLELFEPVLEVLALAHEQGIVHRDIKPSNVFLTEEGQVKVLDFGIARVEEDGEVGESTSTGSLLGSAPFMSPEQARGRWSLVDGRSDLFSVGASLFQMISGQHVHAGGTQAERLGAAMHNRARALATAAPDVVPEVCAVVDRALQYEREARYQSAEEMLVALQAARAAAAEHPGAPARTAGSAKHQELPEPSTVSAATYESVASKDEAQPATARSRMFPMLAIGGIALIATVSLVVLAFRGEEPDAAAATAEASDSPPAEPPAQTPVPAAAPSAIPAEALPTIDDEPEVLPTPSASVVKPAVEAVNPVQRPQPTATPKPANSSLFDRYR